MTLTDDQLTARMEPFDSFWEAPKDIERGYDRFYQFYRRNYLRRIPANRDSRILVISCGPGYFVNMLGRAGYTNVLGIDSYADKVAFAKRRDLNCSVERVFGFLEKQESDFDVIVAEQELNHLTKSEILAFLHLSWEHLAPGGTLVVHSINGTSPLTGSESRAGNFDHYNSFTEYSLQQALEHCHFEAVELFPLDLYVFYYNPLNYIAMLVDRVYTLIFRMSFILVGKSARIFTKKLGAVAIKPCS